MVRTSKAQAATEYLIIVSIVVVIALVAVNSISTFPSLISGTSQSRSADFWNRADIAIVGQTIYADGNAVLMIKNRKGYAIDLIDIVVDGKTVPLGNLVLAPGDTKTVKIVVGGGTQGSQYSKPVSFVYADSEQPKTELIYAPDVPLVKSYE